MQGRDSALMHTYTPEKDRLLGRRSVGCVPSASRIDWLFQPLAIPMDEQIQFQRQAFECENLVAALRDRRGTQVVLQLTGPPATGFSLIGTGSMDDLPRDAQDAFVAIGNTSLNNTGWHRPAAVPHRLRARGAGERPA